MVFYEVTARVEPAVAGAYERYIRDRHVADVLASGCFRRAVFLKSADGSYRVCYELDDQATLDRYLRDHAPALRDDFARHFPGGVTLSRQVWSTIEEWKDGVRAS